MRRSKERDKLDEFIREYRKTERKLRDMESQGELTEAYFELLKKAEPVRKAAEIYRLKYKSTYYGESFDAVGAFESYIRFCELRSSRKRDIAPSEETWLSYRIKFFKLCMRGLSDS